MIASGIVTYGFKTYLGEWAEDKIHSRLGARANFVIIFIYFLSKNEAMEENREILKEKYICSKQLGISLNINR